MNRRNFLSSIIAAPAIIDSTGLFRGACDVWVPDTVNEIYRDYPNTTYSSIRHLHLLQEAYRASPAGKIKEISQSLAREKFMAQIISTHHARSLESE